MAFTEMRRKGNKKQYYRTVSVREGDKVSKKRKYLGSDLDDEELAKAEAEADRELGVLENILTGEEADLLDSIRKEFAREPKESRQNRYEAFVSRFTHDSTAIEGNTLTLRETATVLFDGIAPSGKSLAEVAEILGHRKAFDLMLEYEGPITNEFIFQLHEHVLRDTVSTKFKEQIGAYRKVPVYIRGVEWTPPGPEDVPGKMDSLLRWHSRNRKRLHPVVSAVRFHAEFEMVHPFIDGNGRVGRLLLNFILHGAGYPMVNIPNERKNEYYDALDRAQTKGDLRPLIVLVIELLEGDKARF